MNEAILMRYVRKQCFNTRNNGSMFIGSDRKEMIAQLKEFRESETICVI